MLPHKPTQPPLPSLFSYSHIAGVGWEGEWTSPSTWRFVGLQTLLSLRGLVLAAYAPFGICLAFWRFCWLLALGTLVAVLPLAMSRILIRIARNFTVLLTGVWVRQHARPGTIHPNNNPQVIIACNHRTAFDLLPFIRVCSPSVLLDKGFFESSFLVRPFLDAVNAIRLPESEGNEARALVRKGILADMARLGRPLVFFPEGWDTAGRAVLRFHKYLFSLGVPVVPVALKVVPLLPLVQPGLLGTSILRELLWLFFVPVTVCDLTFLPAVTACTPHNDHDAIQAAEQAQRAIADCLGVPAVSYTKREALAFRRALMTSSSLRVAAIKGTLTQQQAEEAMGKQHKKEE